VALLAQGTLSVVHLSEYLYRSPVGDTIRSLLTDLSHIAPLVGLTMMAWSLTRAYRNYIGMPHAFGVAISAMAVGTLTSLALYAYGWMW
jgi:hypothetical protein